MMKKKRKIVVFLTFIFTLSMMLSVGVNAADSVDVERKDCSIEFEISGDDRIKESLRRTEIKVKLYKVADIDSNGEYTAVEGFRNLDVSALGGQKKTYAEDWLKRADKASEMVTDTTKEMTTVLLREGSGTTGAILPTGLYLVVTEKTMTDGYEYSFQPYLLSLPGNYYYETGNDEWVYELKGVGLKPEQTSESVNVADQISGRKAGKKNNNIENSTNRTSNKNFAKMKTVKTGDSSRLELLGVCAVLSGMIFVIAVFYLLKVRLK